MAARVGRITGLFRPRQEAHLDVYLENTTQLGVRSRACTPTTRWRCWRWSARVVLRRRREAGVPAAGAGGLGDGHRAPCSTRPPASGPRPRARCACWRRWRSMPRIGALRAAGRRARTGVTAVGGPDRRPRPGPASARAGWRARAVGQLAPAGDRAGGAGRASGCGCGGWCTRPARPSGLHDPFFYLDYWPAAWRSAAGTAWPDGRAHRLLPDRLSRHPGRLVLVHAALAVPRPLDRRRGGAEPPVLDRLDRVWPACWAGGWSGRGWGRWPRSSWRCSPASSTTRPPS